MLIKFSRILNGDNTWNQDFYLSAIDTTIHRLINKNKYKINRQKHKDEKCKSILEYRNGWKTLNDNERLPAIELHLHNILFQEFIPLI